MKFSTLVITYFNYPIILLFLQLEICLAKSKNSFAALQKSRLELEAQIDVKANSIYIDEVKCMTVRASMQHQAY